MTSPASLYDRLGGQPVLDRLARRFYELMREMPEVAEVHAMHLMSIEEVEERLRHFLSGFFGGPDQYRARYGEPMMRRRHLPFAIGPRERDAWLSCMQHALDDVLGRSELRIEVETQIRAFAEHMRNRESSGDARGGGCGCTPGGRPAMPPIVSAQH